MQLSHLQVPISLQKNEPANRLSTRRHSPAPLNTARVCHCFAFFVRSSRSISVQAYRKRCMASSSFDIPINCRLALDRDIRASQFPLDCLLPHFFTRGSNTLNLMSFPVPHSYFHQQRASPRISLSIEFSYRPHRIDCGSFSHFSANKTVQMANSDRELVFAFPYG